MQRRIGINCRDIRHCCGPCSSTVHESQDRIFLKPNNGGRYERFTWQTTDNIFIDLFNVRMCRSCCHRYMEMQDGMHGYEFEAIEMMHRDAEQIQQKFKAYFD